MLLNIETCIPAGDEYGALGKERKKGLLFMVDYDLSHIATGRHCSMLEDDVASSRNQISVEVKDTRILAIGAAGSIGSSTIDFLSKFSPKTIHVLDQNENALAELVRQLRSRLEPFDVEDFQLLPIDFGSSLSESFIEAQGTYDIVLNFAAIKHVRSEKDPFSILQMLETNLVKQARFLGMLTRHTPTSAYFSVSTDKAANPSSFMGATKRAMEHVLFSEVTASNFKGRITSARFANVAFSNGSLLQSFKNRLARGEPIAVPIDIRRYFVSLEESGHICGLVALFLQHGHIGVPDLDPQKNLVLLTDVAERFLRANGYEPQIYEDESLARQNVTSDMKRGRWPMLVTKGNTAGEKPYEEFVAAGESVSNTSLKRIKAVAYKPLHDNNVLRETLESLDRVLMDPKSNLEMLNKDALKKLIARIEPAFYASHVQSDLSLDQRV